MNAVGWVVLVLALAAFGSVALAFARSRRALQKQLAEFTNRLDDAIDGGTAERVETVLSHLEQSADHERARAEGSTRERDRLALAIDASTDGVVIVDADGEVLLRNGPAGRFDDARHADALAAEAMQQLLATARRGEAAQRELQLFGPPRQTLHVRALPLVSDHEIVGAVAFVRDVSEARRVESVRRDFVANVSHELKTPIGALTLLAETIASGEDATVMQQLADRVVREADRLGRIVDDLLNLSLIEAQENPKREPLPLPLLIADALDQVRFAAELGDVPLTLATPVPDVEIVCDRRQVLSALVNLLENAVKYSDEGAEVEVAAQLETGRACISVRDHGIGIPKRDLERIFERFYRVDRARSRQTGGTGLGLSIVRHVAQAHGGEVTVESVEGEGSTFTLHMPFARSTANRYSEAS
ncbi:MAG: signal transduction histidine kinase [Actinomycetia bacterium]|jgi:two-component system sensor histidine kinase SenX3|nr:signal transduction histidine kinase [Actinomycetes bacterium]